MMQTKQGDGVTRILILEMCAMLLMGTLTGCMPQEMAQPDADTGAAEAADGNDFPFATNCTASPCRRNKRGARRAPASDRQGTAISLKNWVRRTESQGL